MDVKIIIIIDGKVNLRSFLYGKLSEINISIVRESMLNREIMGRLAEIYDCLTPENKKKVRVNAILQQRDALTNISNIPRRKTLDDF